MLGSGRRKVERFPAMKAEWHGRVRPRTAHVVHGRCSTSSADKEENRATRVGGKGVVAGRLAGSGRE